MFIPRFIKDLDMFGQPMPGFNINGRSVVKTSFGACVSTIILVLTGMFALLKFRHLVEHKNPSLSTNKHY